MCHNHQLLNQLEMNLYCQSVTQIIIIATQMYLYWIASYVTGACDVFCIEIGWNYSVSVSRLSDALESKAKVHR